MASLIYNSCIRDAVTGAIDFDTDTFKMMLVTSSYTASKAHDKRDDITNEVSGTGYTSGGNACAVTVAATDNTNNDVEINFSITSWTSATITARAAVIYKSRGGASSADELVGYVDFGSDVSSTNGTFAVTVSTPLKFQN
jgi:hypothetical protein